MSFWVIFLLRAYLHPSWSIHLFLHLFVVVVQLLSHVGFFATLWTAARQAPLSPIISWSLLKFMSIELVMPSKHLILCHPLLLNLQSFPALGSFPVSQLFTSGGQSTSTSASVLPMNMQCWFPLGLTGFVSMQSKGLWGVFSSTVQKPQFFGAQNPLWSNSHICIRLLDKPQLWLYRCYMFTRAHSICLSAGMWPSQPKLGVINQGLSQKLHIKRRSIFSLNECPHCNWPSWISGQNIKDLRMWDFCRDSSLSFFENLTNILYYRPTKCCHVSFSEIHHLQDISFHFQNAQIMQCSPLMLSPNLCLLRVQLWTLDLPAKLVPLCVIQLTKIGTQLSGLL